MRVRVRLFGYAAELAGCREAVVETAVATVAAVAEVLGKTHPSLKPALDGRMKYAVGTEYAEATRTLREGDVVTLIPPVGGG